ncbi:hypothetical protein [Serratia marcescens]|uniref:hypothetical protein n=1 Tax=Serratia marcescens TaxID=615 RepID=UPI00237F8FFD|nr:hypothetical protein [Serratia marcescens]
MPNSFADFSAQAIQLKKESMALSPIIGFVEVCRGLTAETEKTISDLECGL